MDGDLGTYFVQVLQKAGVELAIIMLVLVAIGVPLALAAYALIRRMGARRSVNVSLQWGMDGDAGGPRPIRPIPEVPAPVSEDFSPRRYLVTVYKVLTAIIAVALLAGAVLAWWSATSGNGLLLVAIILFVLSLFGFGAIGKYDRQEQSAAEWRGLWDGLASKINVSNSHATPEVHRLDDAAIARARDMAKAGATLDDICRAVDPGYAGRDKFHREAFRRVMRAALESSGLRGV